MLLLQNQIYFVFKVFAFSAFISFFIKYGLDNFLLPSDQAYLAIAIILSPVLSLLVVLLIRQNNYDKEIENTVESNAE